MMTPYQLRKLFLELFYKKPGVYFLDLYEALENDEQHFANN